MARIESPENGGEKPRIDRSDVVAFFEERARRIDTLGPMRAVIYQDKHPDLAVRRDAAEKARLLPLLDVATDSRVLDVGCGTGRWADELVGRCAHYRGIDISDGLVGFAKARFAGQRGAVFSVASIDAFSLDTLGEIEPFNRILCAGVLIYLNDEELLDALGCIFAAAAPGCRIVFREPVALTHRLSIVEHFSDELEQNYNAIYRTQAELESAIAASQGAQPFRVTDSGEVYDEASLNNRRETIQRWLVLERAR